MLKMIYWSLIGAFILSVASSYSGYHPDGMIRKVDSDQKQVVLTFDDGPLPKITDQILEILEEEKVKAVFFLIGKNMVKYPELIRKIYFAGHDLGNHTYNHLRLDSLSMDRISSEVQETTKLFRMILGLEPIYFRPPGGRCNKRILDLLDEKGLQAIGWTINANDFLYKKRRLETTELSARVDRVLAIIRSQLKPGAIILMHNGSDISIAALRPVIHYIRQQGYEFVTLSQLKH